VLLSAQNKDLTLTSCIKGWGEVEAIPDGYCSKCMEHQKCEKKLELWRLPPVLVIQLKRFCTTNGLGGRKLRNKVEFPIDGLDLGCIFATGEGGGGEGEKVKAKVEVKAKVKAKVEVKEEQMSMSDCSEDDDEEEEEEKDIDMVDLDSENSEDSEEEVPEAMRQNDGRNNSQYDLYAIVHHIGAMGAGHYVASVREEGSDVWRTFNDAQVTEVEDPASLIDASAYILFYIRRDVKQLEKNGIIEKFWQTKNDGDVDLEEINRMLRQRDGGRGCVIS